MIWVFHLICFDSNSEFGIKFIILLEILTKLIQDALDKTNPLLRALAVRTMGCLGVRQVIEYLVDPLRQSLSDEDSYVRKTGVLCVAKIYDSFPEIIEENNFIGSSPFLLMFPILIRDP